MSRFNLSALAVRERAVTLFLLLAISLSGVYAFWHLGRAEDPSFTIKVLTVSAVWPGATAREMQDEVADPLEKRLQELAWYDRVETFTRPGMALMTLVLKDDTPASAVADQFYQARKKLGDSAHDLPQGVLGPFVNDEYADVDFALYAVTAPGMAPRDLTRQAETVRQSLLGVPGVKKVDLLGEQAERVYVDLSPARLATLGIPAQAVFQALARQNRMTAAGSVQTRGPDLFVRLDGAYHSLADIADTPIAAPARAGQPARGFRLGDIATVARGTEDPASFLIRLNGQPAMVLAVVMQQGWNGLTLGKALKAEQTRLSASLPLGVHLTRVTDQAVNIRGAIDEFMLKFFAALGVVMLVGLVSLGWRVGVVVAAAVPLTLAAVFVIMLISGRVFDRVTLGALIISLGLLVDDAIIAIEIMVVRLEEGYDRIKAAAYAWSHTAAPMLSGTLVTIIGFTPVGFARSAAGEYAGNVFWIVGFALITSWVVAVVFTPYLGVKLLPAIQPVPGGLAAIYDTPRYRRFRALVAWVVGHRLTVVAAVAAAFLLALALMGLVKNQFFPVSDRPELMVEVQMPEGTGLAATAATSAKVEGWLRRQPEARLVTAYIGQGAPRFFLSYNPELPDPAFAKILVQTPSPKARDALKLRLRRAVADGLAPEAYIRATQLVFGPAVRFQVNFRVSGPDPATLFPLAERVRAIMAANPHTRQTTLDWGEKTPTLHFTLDRARLEQIGLSPQEVARQMQFLLDGVPVAQLREDIRTVEIVARAAALGPDRPARLDPARLTDLTLTTRDGRAVPLSQIGHLDIRDEYPILRRRDRVPTITVQCDTDDAVEPPDISRQIETALAPVEAALPEGYHITAGGNIEDSAIANRALVPIYPIMAGLILLVIVVQVRSLPAMVMVFLTAPLGLVGTVPTLLLFGQPFGFNAILGLIGLSGILMRNTLILIGQIDTNRKAGLSQYEAVIEATVQRARPVVLTALAAVLAFIPLTQSVFFGSMAYTLIGGTAAGTVLILLFLPALYAVWFKVNPPDRPASSAIATDR